MDDLDNATWSKLQSKGVLECQMVYGDFIYPKNAMVLNESVFTKEILRLFPNKTESGLCILDWEGKVYENLVGRNVSRVLKDKAQREFIKAIKLAKSLRPNVKWGFFGLPQDNYDEISEEYLTSIYALSDVISPAVYLSSPLEGFDKGKMNRSAQIAKKHNKLLLPVVWDRFNTLDKKYRQKLMSNSVFVSYTKKLMDFSYNGRASNGVIYWGRDTWLYLAYKTAVNEAPSIDAFKTNYSKRVTSNSLNVIGKR